MFSCYYPRQLSSQKRSGIWEFLQSRPFDLSWLEWSIVVHHNGWTESGRCKLRMFFVPTESVLYWLVVWNIYFFCDFPYIGNFIIPTDELHHFSEGLRPPTRKVSHNMSLKLTCSKTPISKTWNQVMSTAPRAFAIASAVHWPMANMLQFRRRVHAIVRSSVRCFEEPSKFKGGISMPMLYCYIQTFFWMIWYIQSI